MIEVNNLTDGKIDLKFFRKIAEKILNQEKKRKLSLSIAFVKPLEIKELNKKYRKKNKATDVLSFLYGESGQPASLREALLAGQPASLREALLAGQPASLREALLAGQPATLHEALWAGEIVICPQEVKKNIKIFKSYFKRELVRVLIHGILHLMGYDHEKSLAAAKIMEKKQNYYLEKFF